MLELKIGVLTKEYIEAKRLYCDIIINSINPSVEYVDSLIIKLNTTEAKLLMECVRLYGDK